MWDFSLHKAGLKNRNKLKLYDYKYESKGLLVKYVRKNLSTYMVIYRPSPNLV